MGYELNDFQTDVLEQSLTIPVLVDFWAEWCAPCRMIGPVLEKLAEAHKDKLRLVKIDTEQHPEIAGYLGIRSIPNVKLFIDGQVSDEFSGALPEEAIAQWLQRAIPALQPGQIEQAKMLLSAERTQEARRLLQAIIANESETEEARVLLAQIDIYSDKSRRTAERHRTRPGHRTGLEIRLAIRVYSIVRKIVSSRISDSFTGKSGTRHFSGRDSATA